MDRRSPGIILVWSTVCLFLTSFAFAAYGIFKPALLQEFGSSDAEAALPFALLMLMWGIMQPITGAIADARGTRPVILAGVLFMALGFVFMGLSQQLWQVAIGFGILVGIATSSCGSIMFSLLISKCFGGARRGAAVGLLQGASPASPMIMTPLVFIAITQFGWRAAALGLGLFLLLAALPIAFWKVHDPAVSPSDGPAPAGQGNWRESIAMLRLPPLRNLFVSRFACGLSFLIIPHLATAATAAGLSAQDGAIALTVYGASGAVGSYLGGLLADRWGRVNTLVATYAVRGAGALMLALLSQNNALLFFLAVAMTGGPIFATVGINNVQAYELMRGKNAGLVLGLGFVLHQLAASISPVLGGLIFDWTGSYHYAFLILASVLFLATIPAAYTGMGKLAPRPSVSRQPVDAS